jgi:hypothetical protein
MPRRPQTNPFNQYPRGGRTTAEADREREELAAMQALQREQRAAVLAQPRWRLPEPGGNR